MKSCKSRSVRSQLLSALSPKGSTLPGERGPCPSFLPPLAGSAGLPLPPAVSHHDSSFPCLKRGDSVLLPVTRLRAGAGCSPHLPVPSQSLSPSPLQTPEQSAVERPSPVQGFSLTPGYSHKPPLSQPHLQLLMTTPSPPLDLSNKGRQKKCFILSLRVPNVCSSISYCSRS